MKDIKERLDTLMASLQENKNEERYRDDLDKMRSEICDKLDTLTLSLREAQDEDANGSQTAETETESLECPPQLSIKIPKKSDLPRNSSPWNIVELPIDILLITVEDEEFLSCFSYLEKPFKSYYKDIGFVYFGSIGSEVWKEKEDWIDDVLQRNT